MTLAVIYRSIFGISLWLCGDIYVIANITIIREIDKCLWINVFGGEFYLW